MATAISTSYEALGQQADALKIIFESLPIAVVVADSDGRILFWNPAADDLLRSNSAAAGVLLPSISGWYRPDQRTLLTPDELPLARAIHGERVSDELIFIRETLPYDPTQPIPGAWIRANAWPLRDDCGPIYGGVLMFHDFTGGHEALQTLTLLARVVEQTTDNVVLTDRHGAIQYVNPAFENTTGYTKKDVLGLTPRFLKSGMHDAGFYREMWQRLQDGRPCDGMIINRKKSGELYWAQQAITPIRDAWGNLTHFVSVGQDITELRKKEEQEFQLQLARDVQRQFYAPAPCVPGLDIGAAAFPAYETGGDYFDFIAQPDGSLVIAVGDVEGHGFGSALVMALTRAYVRSFVAVELCLNDVLSHVNRMLYQDLENGRFVTLALARIDSTRRTLAYASAGHVNGLLLAASGEETSQLESTGPPLGLFPDSKFEWRSAISLQPNEILVLSTDGAAESAAPDGIEFGNQRVLDYVRDQRQLPAQEIVNGLYEAARRYVQYEPQLDDITSVIVKID